MEERRFPKGYEQNTNYKYHIAVMYFIRNCKLALSVKSYNNKVKFMNNSSFFHIFEFIKCYAIICMKRMEKKNQNMQILAKI